MSRTIALYGGSFDPPHVSHVLTVAYVLSAFDVDAVWVLPVNQHPLAKNPASWEQRLSLCRAAFSIFGSKVEVRSDERQLGGAGRTFDLLQHLRKHHPKARFRLVIGSDQLSNRHAWHRFDEVCAMAPPIVLARVGHPTDPAFAETVLLPEMSSTDARAAMAGGELPAWLPAPVRRQIVVDGLYGLPRSGADADGRDA
ncbi:MAG: nicotinate-nicotinamide nucleotide adenylyltransferase [Myxococcales bacterium]|nr:nicotinate-nicotinamide nucleotide adenylyltransferase [Myxococcales bacterium]